jgi:hypothetical protein
LRIPAGRRVAGGRCLERIGQELRDDESGEAPMVRRPEKKPDVW